MASPTSANERSEAIQTIAIPMAMASTMASRTCSASSASTFASARSTPIATASRTASRRRSAPTPTNPDTDGDGWSDFDEVINRYYGFDPLVPTLDTDFDGLSDDLELRIASSPTNRRHQRRRHQRFHGVPGRPESCRTQDRGRTRRARRDHLQQRDAGALLSIRTGGTVSAGDCRRIAVPRARLKRLSVHDVSGRPPR